MRIEEMEQALGQWFSFPFRTTEKEVVKNCLRVTIELQLDETGKMKELKKALKKRFKDHGLGFWSLSFMVDYEYKLSIFHTFYHEKEIEEMYRIIKDVTEPFLSQKTKRDLEQLKMKREKRVPKRRVVVEDSHSVEEMKAFFKDHIHQVGLVETMKVSVIERGSQTYELQFFYEEGVDDESIDSLMELYRKIKIQTQISNVSYEERNLKIEKQKEMFRLRFHEAFTVTYEEFGLIGKLSCSIPDGYEEKTVLSDKGIEGKIVKESGKTIFEVVFQPDYFFESEEMQNFMEEVFAAKNRLFAREKCVSVPIPSHLDLVHVKEKAERLLSESAYRDGISSLKVVLEEDAFLLATIDLSYASFQENVLSEIKALLHQAILPKEKEETYYIIED
jgi:hypothetical protein